MRVPLEQVIQPAALRRIPSPQTVRRLAVAHAHGGRTAAVGFFQQGGGPAVFVVEIVGRGPCRRLAGTAVVRGVGGGKGRAGDGGPPVLDVKGQAAALVGRRAAVAVKDVA